MMLSFTGVSRISVSYTHLIRQGGIVAIAVQNPYKMGYTACQSLLEIDVYKRQLFY